MNPQISHGYGQYANVSRIMLFVDCRESCPSITYDKSILNENGIQSFDVGKCNGGHFDVFQYAPLLGKLSGLVELSAVTR
jgi:hypothetical protein